MEHNTKIPGYPHPSPQYPSNPPPQYTPNPIPLQPMQPPVIAQQPVHVVHLYQNPVVGPEPTMIVCSNCHRNVLTRLEYEATTRTHCVALTCCIFGLFPCAVLPYFINSCQNANHYCPHCGGFVGTYTT